MKMDKLDLEVEIGYEYLVEGHENINEFAKGILALTNARSSAPNTIADFRTFKGTNQVKIYAFTEQDKTIEAYVGKIIHKNKVNIVKLTFDDLTPENQKNLQMLEDNYLEKDGEDTFIFYEK